MPVIYVMWVVALLTTVALTALSSGMTSYQLARNLTEMAEREALSEAAINRAVLGLLEASPQERWRAGGALHTFAFGGVEIGVTIHDEVGRIDLNHADASLLARLFRAAGVSQDQADVIADRIIDWRDADDLKRLHGAERAEYKNAGFPDYPRNGQFQDVEELQLVLGIPSEVFHQAESALTVYSGRPMIDPRFATGLAAQAISSNTTTGSEADTLKNLNGRAFRIHTNFVQNGEKVARETVIRLTGDPATPFWVLYRKKW